MTTSEDVRALADQGLSVSEIARKLDISHQHAYGVLMRRGTLPPRRSGEKPVIRDAGRARTGPKPRLSVDELVAGFTFAGR